MKIKANAKINLSLAITGKRSDGYHLIDTVMHSVSLFDEIEIEKSDELRVECDKYNIPQEENIAFKAANLFFSETKIKNGAKITIRKNIPAAAGVGGGSADAAAVLLGLDRLYNANLSCAKLCEMALKLGADVPFFIKGGCQRAQGIGEELTPITPLNRGYILLAKADTKPSTAEMYRLLDSKEPEILDTEKVIKAVENNDLNLLSNSLFNAFLSVWGESELKQRLLELSPLCVSLSGSGPTHFALFDDLEKAKTAQKTLENQNIDCWLADFCDKAIIFE
jgi:4-diphosphocytidyl-2-C-methyl-D-erythritol kinase